MESLSTLSITFYDFAFHPPEKELLAPLATISKPIKFVVQLPWAWPRGEIVDQQLPFESLRPEGRDDRSISFPLINGSRRGQRRRTKGRYALLPFRVMVRIVEWVLER